MKIQKDENNPNHFKIYLERRGILPSHLHTYICHEYEDQKLGKPPDPQTVVNWVEGKGCWQLTLDRWQAIASAVNLTSEELKILCSGRNGCTTYNNEEITRVMKRRLAITDPDFDLRYLIKLSGLTQSQFAELLGVAPTTVRRWCAGLNKPVLDSDQIDLALTLLKCTSKEFKVAAQNAHPVKSLANEEKKIKKIA